MIRHFCGNPYKGFDYQSYQNTLWGWNSADSVFRTLIEQVRPNLIIEVGSWLGASAIHMATIIRELDLSCQIICVDSWLGSPEMYSDWHPDKEHVWAALDFRYGFPRIYEQFLANVCYAGVQDYILPLPQTSFNASVILADQKISADLIYVDAGHDYPSVFQDIGLWRERLTKRGLLFGDDFNWPSVQSAVIDYCNQQKAPYSVEGVKWVLR